MTFWRLISCLNPFVVKMLRSRKDSLPLAVIFMSPLAMSQRSIDVWVGPRESWIHLIMGCDAVGTCAGRNLCRTCPSLQVLGVNMEVENERLGMRKRTMGRVVTAITTHSPVLDSSGWVT